MPSATRQGRDGRGCGPPCSPAADPKRGPSATLRSRLAALPGRRTRALQAALDSLGAGPQVTRRQLEERMLALIARHRLPRPLVNTFVAGKEVDFLWPQARLIVETDGAATHLTATAFEEDRARDAKLAVAGYRVVRFTWRQLTERPGHTARTVRALLAGPNGANL